MPYIRTRSIAVYVASFTFSIALAQSNPAAATATPQQSVTVVNTAAQPVPVQVVNPVQAPGSVTINNSPAQPVPTITSTAQERSPIFGQILSVTMTGIDGSTSFVQSTGRRAMIRHMSIRCSLPSPEEVHVSILGKFGLAPMAVALTSSFLKIDRAIAIASMPVDLMIDSGSETTFEFARSTPNVNTAGTATCQVFLTGYTVPQP